MLPLPEAFPASPEAFPASPGAFHRAFPDAAWEQFAGPPSAAALQEYSYAAAWWEYSFAAAWREHSYAAEHPFAAHAEIAEQTPLEYSSDLQGHFLHPKSR